VDQGKTDWPWLQSAS